METGCPIVWINVSMTRKFFRDADGCPDDVSGLIAAIRKRVRIGNLPAQSFRAILVVVRELLVVPKKIPCLGASGSEDSDGDGVVDACDLCPATHDMVLEFCGKKVGSAFLSKCLGKCNKSGENLPG